MDFKILILFLVSYLSILHSTELGSSCSLDKQCTVKNSICRSGVCTCKHYYAKFNSTECLNSKLLDNECLIDEQCSLRVANSICKNGLCDCSKGFIHFRKHTCLKPAKVGDVCYSDEHCQMGHKHSFCEFVIPNLFGKCLCTHSECFFQNFSKVEPNKSTQQFESKKNVTEENKKKYSELLENSWNENNSTDEEMVFLDPFSHQKEYYQDTVGQNNETEPEKTFEENESNELKVKNTSSFEMVSENSMNYTSQENNMGPTQDNEFKYRVETNQKDLHYQVALDNIISVSLGYPCQTDIQCQKRDNESKCINNVCDCISKNNDKNFCGQENTGCPPETFQCRSSGKCISWFFVCNGKEDCDDGSDEECKGPVCPRSSFQCGSHGNCVSLAVLCDGIANCHNGEDERFCFPQSRNSTEGCPDNTFQCANGECLPKFEFCNAIPKCSDASDEFSQICKPKILKNIDESSAAKNYCPFKCGNGKCRSTAIVCSGRDGCGDSSDEAHCSVCRCAKT